jgi:hypothetical protein
VDPSFEHDPLLTRSYELPRGPRVRLRLAQGRDVAAIRALLRGTASERDSLDIGRLVRFDPRRRVVICATALIGSVETIVGVGAIDLDAPEPDIVMVDDELTDGLAELLTRALVVRATEFSRRHAA